MKKAGKMKCTEPHRNLFSYAEGSLGKEEAFDVERHLDDCSACGEFLSELSAVLAVIESEKSVEENPFFHTRVEARMVRAVFNPVFTLKRLVPTMVAALFFAGGVFAGINLGRLHGNDKDRVEALVYETKQYLDDFTQEPIESYIIDLYTHGDDTK
jgi:hypothetical protein